MGAGTGVVKTVWWNKVDSEMSARACVHVGGCVRLSVQVASSGCTMSLLSHGGVRNEVAGWLQGLRALHEAEEHRVK